MRIYLGAECVKFIDHWLRGKLSRQWAASPPMKREDLYFDRLKDLITCIHKMF